MTIDAAAAGRDAGALEAKATKRRLMAYAAGIGAEDHCYFDDEGGVVGHPAFCVSLEWPVVSGPAYLAAIGRSSDAPRGAVHVLQDSRFHKLIRADDRLRTRARIVQVRQTGAGVLVMSCVDTFESATYSPVVTTWTAAMFLRDKLQGSPTTNEEPPALRNDADVTVASQRIAINTSPGLAHRYSECASIWNPIHTERSAARAIGLPDIVLHGTCTWALAGQALIHAAAAGEPRRLRRLAGRFKGVVIPGERLELEYGRESETVWQFAVRTPRGELAITHGVAEIGA